MFPSLFRPVAILTIIQNSSVTLWFPSSAYRVSDRLLSETGNLKLSCLYWQFVSCFPLCHTECLADSSIKQKLWRTFPSSLTSSPVTFLWVLHVDIFWHSNKQFRQEHFLAQMASLATLKINSIRTFFSAYHSLEVIGASRRRHLTVDKKNKIKVHKIF